VFRLWKMCIGRLFHNLFIFDPEGIAEAIQFIVEHSAESEQMGKNGRRAVEGRYNWGVEEKKLLGLYKEVSKCT